MTRRITVRSGAVPRKVIPPASAAVRGPVETTVLVAASDARSDLIAVADFVCDGVDDQVQIQAAINLVRGGSGGVVQLTEGQFNLSDQIQNYNAPVSLQGAGIYSTFLISDGTPPSVRQALVQFEGYVSYIADLSVEVFDVDYGTCIWITTFANPSRPASLYRVGVTLHTGIAPAFAAVYLGSSQMFNCTIGNGNKGNGIFVSSKERSKIIGCTIHKATADGDGDGFGIVTQVFATSTQLTVLGNHIDGCAVAAMDINSSESIIVANHCDEAIIINADDCVVAANHADVTVAASTDGTVLSGNLGTITDNGTNTTNSDFPDNFFSVFNAADPTKIFALDVSGVATGTTRTLIVPDKNGTIGIDGAIPVKTDTGDPGSPFEGQIYVNTFDNKVRVYADGAWRDLVTWV